MARNARTLAALAVGTTAVTLLAMAPPAAAADRYTVRAPATEPGDRLGGDLEQWTRQASGEQPRRAVFVQLAGEGRLMAGQRQGREAGSRRVAQIERSATAVTRAATAADPSANRLYTTRNAAPGVALHLDVEALRAVAKRSDVVRVLPIAPKRLNTAGAAQVDGALRQWQRTGLLGHGVKVGVIDTGVDYTHADFGGPGTKAAFDAAKASNTFTPSGAVVGGYDFAGDAYTGTNTPQPDANPLDCDGHGTHVAGIVAGRGVTANGKTFTGSYRELTGERLHDLKVGPGMAPGASLYALRVFGCDGETNLTAAALDWSLDPNGDGEFTDRLDIVNLSLGMDFGAPDDADSVFTDWVAEHGVLPVVAAGNAGDVTGISGSPGNAVRALTVASGVDPYQKRDGLRVDAPSGLGVQPGQFSTEYPWGERPKVSGSVVRLSQANADGCAPLSAADAAAVRGKVAWLEWDDNDATRRCGSAARAGHVASAGAIGAVFTSARDVFGAGIAGTSTIPVVQLTGRATAALRPALADGSLRVTFDAALRGTIKDIDPALNNTVSGFTSRGGQVNGRAVKPEVTAPGDTIDSAAVGTGSEAVVESGTSMATPMVAGIAALVLQKRPNWTPEQVKTAIVNSATDDLRTEPGNRGVKFGPARVGAGQAMADRAVGVTSLAHSEAGTGTVSLSFGSVVVPIDKPEHRITKKVTVRNLSRVTRTYDLRYQPLTAQPGVRYSVRPSVQVPAGGSVEVGVTVSITSSELRRVREQSMAAQQYNSYLAYPNGDRVLQARQFLPAASGRLELRSGEETLRVPVYTTAKPASTTTARLTGAPGRQLLVQRGAGVGQGEGDQRFSSRISVLSLGAQSPKLPPCENENAAGTEARCLKQPSSASADLRYVGAGAAGDKVWFGISTWAPWSSLNPTQVAAEVDIDTTGDGKVDFYTIVQAVPDTDLYSVFLVRASDDVIIGLEPLNTFTGERDSNVFDNDVAVFPVDAKLLGMKPGAKTFPIRYSVVTGGAYAGDDGVLDRVGPISFDIAKPAVKTSQPLFGDHADTKVPLTGSAPGAKALVLHLAGQPGKRAEVLDLAP